MCVMMVKVVGPDLATRNVGDNLFKLLEQSPKERITMNFSDVSSISRSFAHEYITKRKLTTKIISETNVPANS